MNYAIKKLEENEFALKEIIQQLSEREVEASVMKKHLEDVQMAILVLNASQPIINIGQMMVLKNLKK